MMDLFDFARASHSSRPKAGNAKSEGEQRRDAGLAAMASHNPSWMQTALRAIAAEVAPGTELMGEDLRLVPGIGTPDHPNAWGALVRSALKRGLLEETGRFEKAKRKSIHAHRLAVYRRTEVKA